ncbi:MAG: hypothetical protein JWP26_4343 [Devosia sp.]|uniref:hypothetical protein n=1 Tax=Devosia sp. TaxID=1871048 RepID=UPI00261E83F2|nr:hypothetical protein [Devosia sp.]MDB5589373.1 hypothetical protein [Devosia sp.]
MLALLIVVTLINVLVATGFSLAGVFFPVFIVRGGEGSHTAKVFALYGVARSTPLLLVVLWAAFRADGTALIWLGLLAGVIQLADAAVGLQTGDKVKVWGPLGLGAVQLVVVLLAFWFGA